MSSDTGGDPNAFLADYKQEGGWYNEESFGLARYPGMGLGGVALQDIEADTPVFHTPLKYLLTPYTSDLRSKISPEHWDELEGGWSRLILVMMYETERGEKSPWYKYLRSLPRVFTSPMHWTDDERSLLKGTTVSSRIGREEAEQSFRETLEPIIKANPELFPPESTNFDLNAFHLQGSRILSRSFTIPRRRADPELWSQGPAIKEGDDSDDEDEEDEEEIGEAIMIPMADMLNAGYEMGNVHLFGDEDLSEEDEVKAKAFEEHGPGYTMSTTRAITKGEQIFNDYGEPGNWELLRRFGHVDTVELPQEILEKMTDEEIGGYKLGNPNDEVVFELEHVVNICQSVSGKSLEKLEKRAEWWQEQGEDDLFHFGFEDELEDPLVSVIRLMLYDFEFSKSKKTGDLPPPTLDSKVAKVLEEIITTREAEYTGDLEGDLRIVIEAKETRDPKTMAAIIRLGERRVLRVTRRIIQSELKEAEEEEKKTEKRKADKGGETRQVKKGKMKLS